MHRSSLVLLMFCLIAAALSCAGSASQNPNLPPGENPDRYKFAASDVHRDQSPDVPPSELTELATGNTQFAFDLYQQLKGQMSTNIFCSPFSVSQALAMTWAGARGTTESQMSDTMHFTLGQAKLHPAFNKLDLELASRGEGAKGKDSEPFRLNIANSIWGQDGWSWLPAFLDTLALNYGAGMRLVDFAAAPNDCRVIINDWVENKTEDRIKDLLPEGIITTDTRLVLVNAIYFNAAWRFPFEEENTHPGSFHLLDGNAVTADLMEQAADIRYMEGDGYQAVEMEYDGRELSMVILLPSADRFQEIESSLDAAFIQQTIDGLQEATVSLTFPKFEYDSDFSLGDTLIAMGMPDAFSGTADFSGMDGTLRLYITAVVHKAFVSVDEAGTEAAAATAVVVGEKAIPQVEEFRADHPFVFFIRDIETGTILFVGRVLDPTA